MGENNDSLEYFSSVHEEKEIERDMYVDVNIKAGNMSISANGNMPGEKTKFKKVFGKISEIFFHYEPLFC